MGEYSVLFGGDAILLATDPQFSLTYDRSNETKLCNVNKHSPAYEFYLSNLKHFVNLNISFVDPYSESGGFGASSAQFTLLYKLYLDITDNVFDISNFLLSYKALHSSKISPSGADCVLQYYNRNVFFNASNKTVEFFDLNFPNLDTLTFKTNIKISTHQHIKNMNSIDTSELQDLTSQTKTYIISKDENGVAANVSAFFKTLDKMHLVHENTKNIIEKLLKVNGVLAAKGCGAMSADTIIVIFEKAKKRQIISMIYASGLPLIIDYS